MVYNVCVNNNVFLRRRFTEMKLKYKMISVICWTVLFIIRCRFPTTKSIADVIIQRCGRSVLHTYRVFERTEFKFQKCQADLNFLQMCNENNLIPKFLYFKPYDPELRKSEVYRSTQKRFLMKLLRLKERG